MNPPLLYRIQSDGEALWAEVHPYVKRYEGVLVIEHTRLDKLYA